MGSGSRRFWTWVITGILCVLIVVAVNLLVRLSNVRWDLTEDDRYTLPAAATHIASGLEDTLTINVYLSEGLPTYIAHLPRILRNRLDEFKDASDGMIRFRFIDPHEDKSVEEELTDLKMVPTQLPDFDEGKQSVGRYYMWLEFQYQDQREPFNLATLDRALLDPATFMATLPYNIAARIVKVQNPEPGIGVASEKKMPPPQPRARQQPQPTAGLQRFRKGIESHYAAVKDVNLSSGMEIRKDVTTLIVYRPENLSERAVFELDQFLMRGGNVVVMLDNYSMFDIDKQQQFGQGLQQNAVPVRALEHNLGKWLGHFGIVVTDGVVEDLKCASVVRTMIMPVGGRLAQKQERNPVNGFVTARETDKDGNSTKAFSEDSPVFTGLGIATMLWPVPMQVNRETLAANHGDGASLEDLIRTSPDSWVRIPKDGKIAIYTQPPGAETPRGSHVLVAAVHGSFKSYFADKERPARLGPTGDPVPDTPGAADPVKESAKPGQLWVFADGDFASDWWPQLLSRAIPSQEAILGVGKMSSGLINAMDIITLGNADLVEIRRPVLSDRSLRKQEVEKEKDSIRFWTIAVAPLALIGLGLLIGLARITVNRIPVGRRAPARQTLVAAAAQQAGHAARGSEEDR